MSITAEKLKKALNESLKELGVVIAGTDEHHYRWSCTDLATDLAPLLEQKLKEDELLPPISAYKVQKLKHGPHVIKWRDGGTSYAVIGSLHDGTRWYAAANWTSKNCDGIACDDWSKVHDVIPQLVG